MNIQYQKNILRLFLIVTFTLMYHWKVNGQTADTTCFKIEKGWIEKMNNKIALDISLNNSFEIFEVTTQDTKLVLYPNSQTNLRLKLNYRFISFGFQFAPDFIPGNGDEDLKGITKSFELGTELIFKHWITNLSYSKVKGYYLENTNDFIPLQKGDPYIQFPDLQYKGLTISVGYIQNSKFSMRSLTSQTERQLKSAGSFIPIFNFRYHNIDNKSSGASTQETDNIEANIGPGYAYTFVIKENFYLSLGLQSTFGYLNTNLTTRQPSGNIVTKQDNFVLRWGGKTGIGYNLRKFYTGLYANVSGGRYNQENTTAVNFETKVFYHLFLGIRLESPDYLKRFMNKIEKPFP